MPTDITTGPQDTPRRRGTPSTRDTEGSLSVRSDQGATVVLNPTAAALWELLDGQTTVDELVVAATSLFSSSGDDIRRDIFRTLDELRRQDLLA